MTSNLIEVAEELLASAKAYEGDPAKQMELLALSDEVHYALEGPMGTIQRQMIP